VGETRRISQEESPNERQRDTSVEYSMLLEAAEALVSTFDIDTVLRRFLRLVNEILGFEYCTILLVADDGERLEVAARLGYAEDTAQSLALRVGKGLTGGVAQTGEAMLVQDVSAEKRYLKGLEDAKSELVVPLKLGKKVIGVFDVQSAQMNAFDENDVEILSALANLASIALSNARSYREAIEKQRIDDELKLAADIQTSLLPRSAPTIRGYDMFGLNIPSEEVGGDYYDFIELDRSNTGIAIGDVSGKGVPASILVAHVQASLRAQAENLYHIDSIMSKVNVALSKITEAARFASVFYCVLDCDRDILTYCNAGHNPPIVFRQDGTILSLETGGLVLGMFPDATYAHERLQLMHGDVVFMYTDGVTEATDSDGRQIGLERISTLAKENMTSSAEEICSAVISEVKSFSSSLRLSDDITMVVLKVTGSRRN
jgi:sigma-B regulation protein RsbU (phosphoserine phosphatase)